MIAAIDPPDAVGIAEARRPFPVAASAQTIQPSQGGFDTIQFRTMGLCLLS